MTPFSTVSVTGPTAPWWTARAADTVNLAGDFESGADEGLSESAMGTSERCRAAGRAARR
jgi:hypothetical protein